MRYGRGDSFDDGNGVHICICNSFTHDGDGGGQVFVVGVVNSQMSRAVLVHSAATRMPDRSTLLLKSIIDDRAARSDVGEWVSA